VSAVAIVGAVVPVFEAMGAAVVRVVAVAINTLSVIWLRGWRGPTSVPLSVVSPIAMTREHSRHWTWKGGAAHGKRIRRRL